MAASRPLTGPSPPTSGSSGQSLAISASPPSVPVSPPAVPGGSLVNFALRDYSQVAPKGTHTTRRTPPSVIALQPAARRTCACLALTTRARCAAQRRAPRPRRADRRAMGRAAGAAGEGSERGRRAGTTRPGPLPPPAVPPAYTSAHTPSSWRAVAAPRRCAPSPPSLSRHGGAAHTLTQNRRFRVCAPSSRHRVPSSAASPQHCTPPPRPAARVRCLRSLSRAALFPARRPPRLSPESAASLHSHAGPAVLPCFLRPCVSCRCVVAPALTRHAASDGRTHLEQAVRHSTQELNHFKESVIAREDQVRVWEVGLGIRD